MAPLFGFLRRKKDKSKDSSTVKAPKSTAPTSSRWRIGRKRPNAPSETFDPDLFVKPNPSQPWDITHGGLRPVYDSISPMYPTSPTSPVSPARSEAYDGPSPEDYAAWNRQGAIGSLNRYGSGRSSRLDKPPSFQPPISPDGAYFPPPSHRGRRWNSTSTNSRTVTSSPPRANPVARVASPMPKVEEASVVSVPTWSAQSRLYDPTSQEQLLPEHFPPAILPPLQPPPLTSPSSSPHPLSPLRSPDSPLSPRTLPSLPPRSAPSLSTQRTSKQISLVLPSAQTSFARDPSPIPRTPSPIVQTPTPTASTPTPPRTPSPTLSQKMRRRTILGPMPAWTVPPPDSEDPLRRMEESLQAASFLLNKLKGSQSDSSANPTMPVDPPYRHRRAVTAQDASFTSRPAYSFYQVEVDPERLVDPYIDRRKRGSEFHQIMNHGLLLHPGHVSKPSRSTRRMTRRNAGRDTTADSSRQWPVDHTGTTADFSVIDTVGSHTGQPAPYPPSKYKGVQLYDPPSVPSSRPASVQPTPPLPDRKASVKRKAFPLFSSFRKRQGTIVSKRGEQKLPGLQEQDEEAEATTPLPMERYQPAPVASTKTMARPAKITFAESEGSGQGPSAAIQPNTIQRRGSLFGSKKRPSELLLDQPPTQPPKRGFSFKALAHSLSRSKSDKSDRKVRFRRGKDSVIATPATQSEFAHSPRLP